MCIYYDLSDEYQNTVREIFGYPPPSNLSWVRILRLFRAMQACQPGKILVSENQGRICVAVECKIKEIGTFHRRRNQSCASPSTINAIQEFLVKSGIEPVE